MKNLIVLDWRLISFMAPILMMLAFYLPVLVGAILVVRFLGNFGFIATSVLLSFVAELLWLDVFFFNPFGAKVEQSVLVFGTIGTACIGLLIGCAFFLRLSPSNTR